MPVAIYSEDTGRLLVTFDGIPGLDHVIMIWDNIYRIHGVGTLATYTTLRRSEPACRHRLVMMAPVAEQFRGIGCSATNLDNQHPLR